jgi:hypothetical protein
VFPYIRPGLRNRKLRVVLRIRFGSRAEVEGLAWFRFGLGKVMLGRHIRFAQ